MTAFISFLSFVLLLLLLRSLFFSILVSISLFLRIVTWAGCCNRQRLGQPLPSSVADEAGSSSQVQQPADPAIEDAAARLPMTAPSSDHLPHDPCPSLSCADPSCGNDDDDRCFPMMIEVAAEAGEASIAPRILLVCMRGGERMCECAFVIMREKERCFVPKREFAFVCAMHRNV